MGGRVEKPTAERFPARFAKRRPGRLNHLVGGGGVRNDRLASRTTTRRTLVLRADIIRDSGEIASPVSFALTRV